jgi:hypothetical protein
MAEQAPFVIVGQLTRSYGATVAWTAWSLCSPRSRPAATDADKGQRAISQACGPVGAGDFQRV